MNDLPETGLEAAQELRASLERSRGDLAAGRVRPVGAVLAEIHARVLRRIEPNKAASKADVQASAKSD